jgi:hypothetical protein
MIPRWVKCIAASLLTIAFAIPSFGAGPAVEARIEIPPAEVYVLGDDIPLIWEFTNRSTNSLAMLWEGCCRLNGKLDISAAGQPVNVLPPGAASFHSFSKAAELQTDVPSRFSSLLSDWVKLPNGGGFKIAGRYTGVLPSQSPQVAEGLELWRGSSSASGVELDVLSVANYLDQRESRSRQTGIELTLSGANKLPPLELINLSLNIKNIGTTPKEFAWPGPVQLWIVDSDGHRLTQGTRQLRQSGENFLIQPGQTIRREIELNSANLNGAPFGKYQIFLDVAESESGLPRVPSNSVELEWSLSTEDIVQLLNNASGGPSTGRRNPSLKLLRVYLDEMDGRLDRIRHEDLSAKAIKLGEQLQLANCMKPVAPKPGLANLKIGLGPGGRSMLKLPDSMQCRSLVGLTGVEQVSAVYKVRRHLGWDIRVELIPESQTRLDSVFEFANNLESVGVKVSQPVFTVVGDSPGETNTIAFLTKLVGANVVVRLNEKSSTNLLLVAAKRHDPQKPIWMNSFRAGQISDVSTETVDVNNISNWLAQQGVTRPQVLIVLERDFDWSSFLEHVRPIWTVDSQLQVFRSSN